MEAVLMVSVTKSRHDLAFHEFATIGTFCAEQPLIIFCAIVLVILGVEPSCSQLFVTLWWRKKESLIASNSDLIFIASNGNSTFFSYWFLTKYEDLGHF